MKKPKTKAAAKAAPKPEVVQPDAQSALQVSPVPDWVDYDPRADFRLIAWDSDENSVEVLLTSDEYRILKDHLARLRGHAISHISQEADHAN